MKDTLRPKCTPGENPPGSIFKRLKVASYNIIIPKLSGFDRLTENNKVLRKRYFKSENRSSTQMRKVTWKYNLPLTEPGSLYYSKVSTVELSSGTHLGAG